MNYFIRSTLILKVADILFFFGTVILSLKVFNNLAFGSYKNRF
jgi:hypothetical protein